MNRITQTRHLIVLLTKLQDPVHESVEHESSAQVTNGRTSLKNSGVQNQAESQNRTEATRRKNEQNQQTKPKKKQEFNGRRCALCETPRGFVLAHTTSVPTPRDATSVMSAIRKSSSRWVPTQVAVTRAIAANADIEGSATRKTIWTISGNSVKPVSAKHVRELENSRRRLT